jgi:hypothetical protein
MLTQFANWDQQNGLFAANRKNTTTTTSNQGRTNVEFQYESIMAG